MNLAVIDLGSNTFHLLIARYDGKNFHEVYRKRVYARLARTGIGHISEEAFQEGSEILKVFKKTIDDHQVEKVKVVGTEMLRVAPNGNEFVQKVQKETGFNIEIISGQQEAEYIFQGVQQLLPKSDYLIMDIGGGSVEFIIVKDGEQKWMTSLPIGIAVLYFNFQKEDPITTEELVQLEVFLEEQLKPLKKALLLYPVNELVGASGVFETYFDFAEEPFGSYMDHMVFGIHLDWLISSSSEERDKIDAIPKMRKKMIVVASVLIKSVLKQTPIKRIRFSQNSLKEGLLSSLI